MKQPKEFSQGMKTKGVVLSLTLLLISAPVIYLVSTNALSFHFQEQPLSGEEAKKLAQAVTVRLLGESGAGSGILIAFDGDSYTVLTNNHVVELMGDDFQVMTVDGKLHRGKKIPEERFRGLDLGLVSFTAPRNYTVAPIATKKLKSEAKLYAAGFPNYRAVAPDRLEDTRSWGVRAFHFTQGYFTMRLKDKSLEGGYQLGYSNEVEQGMSGGPVLDAYGRVVAVNGRLKYPIQGIDAFPFTDGTKPTKEEYEKMETLSWAVPIPNFLVPSGIEQ